MQPISVYVLFLLWTQQLDHANVKLGVEHIGKASYYAKMFKGRKTACGERFSNQEMTAAHRTLPFNTMVEVTNLSNLKTVIVRITDRGPFSRGRLLDLTHAAARQLDFLRSGEAKVKIKIVGTGGMVFSGRPEFVSDMSQIIEKGLQLPTLHRDK